VAEEPILNPSESDPAAQKRAAEAAKTQSNPSPPKTDISAGIKDDANSYNGKHDVQEWWKVGVETLTLVAVVWYACIASRQLTQMREATIATASAAQTASATLDFTRQINRAYIAVKPTTGRDISSDLPIIVFRMANLGHVPALTVRHQVQGAVCKYPLPPDRDVFNDDGLWQNDGTLGPESTDFYARIHLQPGDRTMLQQDRRLCAYGIVQYTTLNEVHYTRFCYVIGGILPDFTEHCPVHNDSN